MILQVEEARKSFGKFKAVDRANMTIAEGEMVAVIGPNGAGKTTLFNLITGQLKADGGRILFKGENIAGLRPHQVCRRGIGRSFQVVRLFRRLNVFENVQISILSQHGNSNRLFPLARKLAVDETHDILRKVGLLDKAESISGLLSHGDQKLLDIAMALGGKPDLLVLDEPTAGMSPEEAFSTIEAIRRLATNYGLSILFCEHDMAIVFKIAHKIMVMYQGRSLIEAAPDLVRSSKVVQDVYLGSK